MGRLEGSQDQEPHWLLKANPGGVALLPGNKAIWVHEEEIETSLYIHRSCISCGHFLVFSSLLSVICDGSM